MAREEDFLEPFLDVLKLNYLGHPFSENDEFCERMPQVAITAIHYRKITCSPLILVYLPGQNFPAQSFIYPL